MNTKANLRSSLNHCTFPEKSIEIISICIIYQTNKKSISNYETKQRQIFKKKKKIIKNNLRFLTGLIGTLIKVLNSNQITSFQNGIATVNRLPLGRSLHADRWSTGRCAQNI